VAEQFGSMDDWLRDVRSAYPMELLPILPAKEKPVLDPSKVVSFDLSFRGNSVQISHTAPVEKWKDDEAEPCENCGAWVKVMSFGRPDDPQLYKVQMFADPTIGFATAHTPEKCRKARKARG
jgi:hypothetical protein